MLCLVVVILQEHTACSHILQIAQFARYVNKQYLLVDKKCKTTKRSCLHLWCWSISTQH